MIYNWDHLRLHADIEENSLHDHSEYQTVENFLPAAGKHHVFVVTSSIPINKNVF